VLAHLRARALPRSLSIEFLEWLIHSCADETPTLHDELVNLYVQEIGELRSKTTGAAPVLCLSLRVCFLLEILRVVTSLSLYLY
jgi:hypothetical protein